VGGKTLLRLPAGEWVHVTVAYTLGRERTGTYTLSVTLPGQAPRTFDGLACAKPELRRLRWLGWSSTATDERVFYIDNVKLTVEG
jgi:hypothetical protein